MKKLLVVLGALIVLVIVAALVAPFLIPTDSYKTRLIAAVKQSTGRDLRIGGPVQFSILPQLGIEASDVAFANASGAHDPDMMQLKKLEVQLRLLPLLHGARRARPLRPGRAANLARGGQERQAQLGFRERRPGARALAHGQSPGRRRAAAAVQRRRRQRRLRAAPRRCAHHQWQCELPRRSYRQDGRAVGDRHEIVAARSRQPVRGARDRRPGTARKWRSASASRSRAR